ncbi:CHAP domain-containing protein [Bradyrhizobium diazoefficiens]|uniref:Peptidase C51 domain-containing protein n=1 Tax=Bradyrhizobium diazoefficiens TaxID=1355477 RepID=A0A809Y8P2_9BRAD|nr:CHAP domain-containing protein [Bradyrhizobium diazoefficiens]BBZ99865.1 hypothetical protein H12S4_07700 [Bradyrhizobium diazoefficiens]BCA17549.1 hypothetical protein BDHH15_07640 [Bradyrhizobium diazoefficiens]BCE35733.1 hypothetical protein XF3B_07640 [Bradyrhizobium diazoefficiens]BCF49126.1 hypothetical protein XF17B_07640 [Bradyrhizobium diazoefficiens]
MTVSRRAFVTGALAFVGSDLTLQGAMAAQRRPAGPIGTDIGVVPELPAELKQYSDRDDLNATILKDFDVETKGLQPALLAERQTALAIVQKVPSWSDQKMITPYDVASFFLGVAQDRAGKYDSTWPGYMRAWPVRANPLIVEFFSQTTTKPAGDTTAWCSAFVNWCFVRSHTGRNDSGKSRAPTRDAASASWRNWGTGMIFDKGKSTLRGGTPKVGDLVVFVDKGDSAHGHIAFYVDHNDTHVKVLGGNQLEGQPVRHCISEKLIPLWGNVLQIHSIRTDPALHA